MRKLISPAGLKERGITANDSTIWRAERAGRFPKRVYPTPGRKAWFEDEIDQWLEAMLAERDAVEAVERSALEAGERNAVTAYERDKAAAGTATNELLQTRPAKKTERDQ